MYGILVHFYCNHFCVSVDHPPSPLPLSSPLIFSAFSISLIMPSRKKEKAKKSTLSFKEASYFIYRIIWHIRPDLIAQTVRFFQFGIGFYKKGDFLI